MQLLPGMVRRDSRTYTRIVWKSLRKARSHEPRYYIVLVLRGIALEIRGVSSFKLKWESAGLKSLFGIDFHIRVEYLLFSLS